MHQRSEQLHSSSMNTYVSTFSPAWFHFQRTARWQSFWKCLRWGCTRPVTPPFGPSPPPSLLWGSPPPGCHLGQHRVKKTVNHNFSEGEEAVCDMWQLQTSCLVQSPKPRHTSWQWYETEKRSKSSAFEELKRGKVWSLCLNGKLFFHVK